MSQWLSLVILLWDSSILGLLYCLQYRMKIPEITRGKMAHKTI